MLTSRLKKKSLFKKNGTPKQERVPLKKGDLTPSLVNLLLGAI